MNDIPVPIGLIHSFHSYVNGRPEKTVNSASPGTIRESTAIIIDLYL